MFEIPEYTTLARQMNKTLAGKRVDRGSLGNSPHKFVWYNVEPAEFAERVSGTVVGEAYVRGRWLFLPLEKNQILVFGECGGKILYHDSVDTFPKKYHLALWFEDGSALSAMTQMWGAMELFDRGQELQRKYILGMRTTPVDPEFTPEYFRDLVGVAIENGQKTVKAILTQEQLIPGLGNSIAQDIMFEARLHPRQPLESLSESRLNGLREAIVKKLAEATRLGGRNDEVDLYGNPGRYTRQMDSKAVGERCPKCGTGIEKIAYLGGACYLCPKCQAMT
jgi:formamidopyrimidine-DNA glycosylase